MTSTEEVFNSLKIVQELYRDLQYIIEPTAKQLCVPIFDHIYKFKDYKEENAASGKNTFLYRGKRFFLTVTSYKEHFLVSFFDCLEKMIKENNDEACIHIIKLLEFYIREIPEKFPKTCLENCIMKILEVFMNFQKDELIKFQFLHPAFELALELNEFLENESKIFEIGFRN